MNDNTSSIPVPSFVDALIRAVAQKGLTAAATALTGYGVIQSNQQAMFVSLGISAVLWFVSFGWTWIHEHSNQKTIVAAINAPPPETVPAPSVKGSA